MDSLKKKRTAIRSIFSKTVNGLKGELTNEDFNRGNVEDKLKRLNELHLELKELDNNILDLVIEEEGADEAAINKECEKAEEYRSEFIEVDRLANECLASIATACLNRPSNPNTSFSGNKLKTYKLPKIHLQQFDGQLINYLSFWSQFKKIHCDDELGEADKFQYLLQSIKQGTRARELVESYPMTSENYQKAISALEQRFGRKDLLIEVYVRELLKLIITNVRANGREKLPLSDLFIKIEAHLRSLESMGIKLETNAAWLFPMVESCLSEDTLRAWQRSSLAREHDDSDEFKGIPTAEIERSPGGKIGTSHLERLMKFLRNEVEGEQRISLARSGFNLSEPRLKERNVKVEVPVPTANELFSGEKNFKRNVTTCIFCEKSHDSKDCFAAPKMALDQKHDLVKEKKGCFICLKVGHRAKQCKTKVFCLVCSKRHWAVVCPELGSTPKVTASKRENHSDDAENRGENQNVTLSNNSSSREVLLQTLLVRVNAGRGSSTLRAVIDSGSQQSYILKSTVDKLGCEPIGSKVLSHILFGGRTVKEQPHKCYTIEVSSLSTDFNCTLEVLDQNTICGKLPRLKRGPWESELKELGIWLSDYGEGQPAIELLIGADVCGTLFTGRIHELHCGLVATETKLGWLIMGKMCGRSSKENVSSFVTSMLIHTDRLENLWKLEAIGITDSCEIQPIVEMEKAVLNHFHKTLKKNEEGRYEVSLPWVNDPGNLPNNREVAEKRLVSTTKRLKAGERFDDYNAVFLEWLQLGMIEEVPDSKQEKCVHYLPHRAVFKDNSTTSVRPVFDASCKQKDSLSLNDCLAKGPNLLELIPTILFKFREKKIGTISDIKKAFLQISINDKDRDFLRFLWWKTSEQEIREFRHCRVVFGLTCSPFLLGAVINFHLGQSEYSSKTIVEKLRTSFYVDNCVTSVDTDEEAEMFISNATEIMAEAKFDLRGWEKTDTNNMKTEAQPTKVLGLLWDKHEDSLYCDLNHISLDGLPLTRRTILSIVQKVFDPIGFVCPFTLLPKVWLQESWKTKLSWDSELPDEIKKMFLKWKEELPLLSVVKIPRYMTLNDGVSHSLHIFVDASKSSYAAVVFLRSENVMQVKVQLLQAKSRVAPLKKSTIPRLELLACCIGARMASFVTEHLELLVNKTYFWTDSSTALCWIKGNEPWATFVYNRVKEIRRLTRIEDWNHIPGTENPADLPSRGCSVKKLISSRWWEGPKWLPLTEDEWPHSNPVENSKEIAAERKKNLVTTLSCTTDENSWITGYFSRYHKILRMVAWMKRFISNAKGNKNDRVSGELKVSELTAAEKVLVRSVQQEAFDSEAVKKLKSISVFKDEDGLMRVKTKLTDRKDDQNFICPIVLPNKHKLVHCLIQEVHLKMSHAGINILVSKLRQTFWILKARKTIRKVISSCLKCKRHDAKRLESPSVALPENRVRDASVFEVSGVDLAGPVFLKDKRKAWIMLFSCAVYRAIHLELITSLSTQSFLLGFRRFIARRGRPKVVYSDNGTNFVGADNILKTIDWKAIEAEATISRIQWYFNPPAAPWWGGFWERMVQMVKRLLRRVLGQSSLTYEELTTVLYDCEAVVNSRPLTYVSEDTGDFIPLTPAMFLGEDIEVGVPDLDNLDQVNIGKRYRRQQELRDTLRKRFRDEYLSQLVQRPSKVNKFRDVRVGDVVLIENEGKRRISWPMARIIEVHPGRDGHIRVIRLKTTSGELVRPIQRIFPLEISCPGDDSGADDREKSTEVDPLVPSSPAPRVVTRSGRTVRIPARFFE